MLTQSQEQHLQTQREELQRSYETLSKRKAALDINIDRELDSERKVVFQERQAEVVTEREKVVAEMEQIELRLTEVMMPGEIILPPDVTGLVGREAELSYYQAELRSSGIAIITGMAGVGKTALAAMLANRVASPDKIFWHQFYEGEGVDVLVWALARFLAARGRDIMWRTLQCVLQTGGQLPPNETMFDLLLQHARGHGYVLCLDDFHFVEDDPLLVHLISLAQALMRKRELALILTSRQLPVFMHADELKPLAGLTKVDAEMLLRARGFAASEDLLAALYVQTDGNPQFLTLAVDVLKRSSDPARLIGHLDNFGSINGLLREFNDGLSLPEKAVMGAVSVLLDHGGNEGVLHALLDEEEDVTDILWDLADRYLIIRSGEPSDWIYSQHAIVQAFYYRRLKRAKRCQMHLRAGHHYEHVEPDTLRAAVHFEHGGDLKRATDLATGNLWAMVNRGQARPLQLLLQRLSQQALSPVQQAEVNIALGDVYRMLGQSDLARASYQIAFERDLPLLERPNQSTLRAKACVGMADLLEYSAPQEAVEWVNQELEGLEDQQSLDAAALYLKLSGAHFNLSNYDLALDAAEYALRTLGDAPSPLLARTFISLSNASAARGDIVRASEYTKRSLAISQPLGDVFCMLTAIGNSGVDKFLAGDTAGAIAALQEALGLAEKLGSLRDQARLHGNLGVAYVRTGEDDLAFEALSHGVELGQQSNALEYVISAQLGWAELHLRRGELDHSESALKEAETWSQSMEALDQMIEVSWRRAELALARNDLTVAHRYAQQALVTAKRLKAPADEAFCLKVLGQVFWASGDHDAAVTAFASSLALLDGLRSYPFDAACTKMAWGSALLSGSNPDDGRALLQEARQVFQVAKAQPRLAALAELLSA